jgi:uncharacterized membrane protein (DUF106 family)
MYLIIHPIPITTVLASTVASQPDYSGANLILMTVYVAATLALVIITIWQARAVLAASARQSQAAINTVHEQIEASELQSQMAIDAVHEQIEASEKQSQETMYNQFKPVIVPIESPILLRSTDLEFLMNVENKGVGIALNTWGIFYVKIPLSAVYHFNKRYFLVPDRTETIVFNIETDGIKAPSGEFHGYGTYPGQMPGVKDRGMSSGSRLMITYNDVFDNKYLVVFDYRYELGWEQVDLKKVDRRLDELIETVVT